MGCADMCRADLLRRHALVSLENRVTTMALPATEGVLNDPFPNLRWAKG